MTAFFFIVYLLGTIGMTSIIVKGVIFQPFRQFIGDLALKAHQRREAKAEAAGKMPSRSYIEFFNELINCMQCTGFWCGLFCGLLPVSAVFVPLYGTSQNVSLLTFPLTLLFWFCCGTAGSFAASFGDILLEWVFFNKMVAVRKLEEQDRG